MKEDGIESTHEATGATEACRMAMGRWCADNGAALRRILAIDAYSSEPAATVKPFHLIEKAVKREKRKSN